MSNRVSVTREWADGKYSFRMGYEEWRKLDKRFDVGPYEFLRRLSRGTWKPEYPREVIRLMLQAGGSVKNDDGRIDDQRINLLISDYVDERIFQAALFAADVLTEILMPAAPVPEVDGVEAPETVATETVE